jgi:hypothetical protein
MRQCFTAVHIIYSGKLHTQLTGVEWPKCAENVTINCTLMLIDPVCCISQYSDCTVYGVYTVIAFRTVDLSAIHWTQETNYDDKKKNKCV